MKRLKLYLGFLLLSSILFSGCQKGELELKNTEIGVDPAVNIDMVNQLLQLEGTLVEGDLPSKTKAFGGTIYPILVRDASVKVDTIATNYDMPIYVPFNIPNMGFYKIRSLQFKLHGAKSYWKVPLISDSVSTDYAFSFAIPRLIKQSNLRIDFNAELFASAFGRKDSCITDSGSIYLQISNPLKCNDTINIAKSANGIFQKQFILGDKKGKGKVWFKTGGIGDRLDVKYNNEFIISTCPTKLKPWQFPKCNAPAECFVRTLSAYYEYEFDYDPSISKVLDVYVTGYCSDSQTGWSITVNCP
jgi:hypothetical protein